MSFDVVIGFGGVLLIGLIGFSLAWFLIPKAEPIDGVTDLKQLSTELSIAAQHLQRASEDVLALKK